LSSRCRACACLASRVLVLQSMMSGRWCAATGRPVPRSAWGARRALRPTGRPVLRAVLAPRLPRCRRLERRCRSRPVEFCRPLLCLSVYILLHDGVLATEAMCLRQFAAQAFVGVAEFVPECQLVVPLTIPILADCALRVRDCSRREVGVADAALRISQDLLPERSTRCLYFAEAVARVCVARSRPRC
jgi:hypothetical protein